MQEFYIGQVFEDIYPPEAAEWCNNNNAVMFEIDPVVVEDGSKRRFQICEVPEPTAEEQNEQIQKKRARLYAELIDTLHAEKQRKTVLGEWTEENELEYVAEVKRQTLIIQTDNPYIE